MISSSLSPMANSQPPTLVIQPALPLPTITIPRRLIPLPVLAAVASATSCTPSSTTAATTVGGREDVTISAPGCTSVKRIPVFLRGPTPLHRRRLFVSFGGTNVLPNLSPSARRYVYACRCLTLCRRALGQFKKAFTSSWGFTSNIYNLPENYSVMFDARRVSTKRKVSLRGVGNQSRMQRLVTLTI